MSSVWPIRFPTLLPVHRIRCVSGGLGANRQISLLFKVIPHQVCLSLTVVMLILAKYWLKLPMSFRLLRSFRSTSKVFVDFKRMPLNSKEIKNWWNIVFQFYFSSSLSTRATCRLQANHLTLKCLVSEIDHKWTSMFSGEFWLPGRTW